MTATPIPRLRPARAAFLAQLVLQYDGVAQRRVARGDRARAAVQAYGAPRAAGTPPRAATHAWV